MQAFDPQRISRLLAAPGERLELVGERFELVVIGGSALALLGLVERTTHRYLGVDGAQLGD